MESLIGTFLLFKFLVADSCFEISAQDSVAYQVLVTITDTAFPHRSIFFSKIDSLFTNQHYPFYTLKEVKGDTCSVFYLSSGIRLTDSIKVIDNQSFISKEKTSIKQFKRRLQEVVQKCSNAGFPFARVVPSVLYYEANVPVVKIEIDSGPRIEIDSLVVKSEKPVNLTVLKRISGLRLPMLYSQRKLDDALERATTSGFMEFTAPSSVLFTEQGSVLFLYAKQKQSVFSDLIIGLNSDNQRRTILTGEAQLMLSNFFGRAEKISIQWRAPAILQQFLHLRGEFPFLFLTPIGVNVDLQVFRQDSSFARLSSRLGGTYFFSPTVSAGLGWYRESSSSVVMNEVALMPYTSTYQLLQVQYQNKSGIGSKKRGLCSALEIGVGTIRKSENPGNRLRLQVEVESDFPIFRNQKLFSSFVFKSLNGSGVLLNEAFRTGGMGSIRGFNEWTFFVTTAVIGVLEYRFYIDSKAFFKTFYDAGWQILTSGNKGYYQGIGAGLALPVSVGIFHVDVAVGRFPNIPLDIRNTRLHVGLRAGFD